MNIKLFENKQVRSTWSEEDQKWYLSIVDVVGILTESPNPQVYWRVLKSGSKMKGTKPLQIVTV